MRNYRDKQGTYVKEMSLSEALAFVEPVAEVNAGHFAARASQGEQDGFNTIVSSTRGTFGTLQECMNLRNWEAGREMLKRVKLNDADIPAPVSIRRKRRWSVDGDEFNRDRFDAGLDDCWRSRKRQKTAGNTIVHITLERSAGWKIDASKLIWSGLTVIKLVDKLEDAGYRCKVSVCCSLCGLDEYNSRASMLFVVKSPNDPLNIDALLLACAHPAFFRFYCFGWAMRFPEIKVNTIIGYSDVTPKAHRGDIHVWCLTSRTDAENKVSEALRRYAGVK